MITIGVLVVMLLIGASGAAEAAAAELHAEGYDLEDVHAAVTTAAYITAAVYAIAIGKYLCYL